ncbi:hypothetical protein GCM10010441_17960 [Kitasatospora paracochleata]|uniref:Ricin B lectin domain-containing protein n=1 Tax=Kitasatospora paracochleata TaxID=58354 RepID=A0ABT1J9P5_9ACTN|nr:RICIN domain-containing protein [Kitasatospora paracochleata]MCP2314172.1 hypothetical protein [Kitasatospora paracochleata]
MNRTLKAAKLLAAPTVALAFLASVLGATPASAATADAYTFTSPYGTLNATGDWDGNQISVTPDGTNYQNFRLIRLGAPGTFNIASTSSGKCIYASQPAIQQSCGKSGEEWHFRPVDGKPNTFGIVRRDDSSGTEYCMDNRGGLHLWGILAQPNTCNGSTSQMWTVPASKAAEAKSLALDYYTDLCSKKTSTCSWTEKSEGQPEALPRQPASSVWYNDTADKVTQVFTTIYHSGWSQSFSAGLSTSVGVSAPIQAMVSTQLQATTTYESDQSTINGIAVTVPAKNYGWVDFAAVGKKVTGTWTFDTDNQPWTTDATVTVPVINSSAGSTMYIAHTSPNQPGVTPPADTGSTGGTSGSAPTALATTVTKTLDLPAGIHLAAYGSGVKFTDDQGHALATVMAGEVKDKDGRSHDVRVSVSGNTVTQTIADAPGATIEGTMTPPVSSLADEATSPAPASTMALFKANDDKLNDWTRCMRKNMITGMLGGLIGGPEGAMPGMLVGTVGGFMDCGMKPKS